MRPSARRRDVAGSMGSGPAPLTMSVGSDDAEAAGVDQHVEIVRFIAIMLSGEIAFSGLELVTVDLAPGIPLSQDLERRVLPRRSARADEPSNTEHRAGDQDGPQEQHHTETPDSPHRMHSPVPLIHPLLRPC